MRWRAFRAIVRIRMRTLMTYRAAALSSLCVNAMWGAIRVAVLILFYRWGRSQGAGVTLAQSVSYVWLSQCFISLVPFSVDPEISRQIRALVRRLADGGTTVVLTTHYMYEAEELCEETIIISRGRIVGSGTVGDIKGIVSESTVVRVVTDADPLPAAESVRTYPGVRRVSVQSVGGRFDVRIDTDGEDGASMRHIEDRFREYGIRSIGYDEPTLEDAYLRLVEGEP